MVRAEILREPRITAQRCRPPVLIAILTAIQEQANLQLPLTYMSFFPDQKQNRHICGAAQNAPPCLKTRSALPPSATNWQKLWLNMIKKQTGVAKTGQVNLYGLAPAELSRNIRQVFRVPMQSGRFFISNYFCLYSLEIKTGCYCLPT